MTLGPDEIVNLIRFTLLLWGLIYLVTDAAITALPRMLFANVLPLVGKLFIYCAACVGGWVGVLLCYLGYWPWYDITSPFRSFGEALITSIILGKIMSSLIPNTAFAVEQIPANKS